MMMDVSAFKTIADISRCFWLTSCRLFVTVVEVVSGCTHDNNITRGVLNPSCDPKDTEQHE